MASAQTAGGAWPPARSVLASGARSALGAEGRGIDARRGETRRARLDAQHESPERPRLTPQ